MVMGVVVMVVMVVDGVCLCVSGERLGTNCTKAHTLFAKPNARKLFLSSGF